jgi:tRNA (cmo5U34)-methyltransferase
VLDLDTGDGRLLDLVLTARPSARAVGVDVSPPMLDAARARFQQDARVQIVAHDLNDPLPELGTFEVIVSSFAIQHCPDRRKRELYRECFELVTPGGAFVNLEHVASASERLQDLGLAAMHMS